MLRAVFPWRIILYVVSTTMGAMLLAGCSSAPPPVIVPPPVDNPPPLVIAAPEYKSTAMTAPAADAASKDNSAKDQTAERAASGQSAGKAFDAPEQQMFYNTIVAANGKGGFLNQSSFIMSWYLIGPFKFKSVEGNIASQAIHREFIPCEKVPSRNCYRWTFSGGMAGKVIGEVDLGRVYGNPEPNTAAYALTLLYAPDEMSNLTLLTGSDDYIKVWINGKLVHAYNMTERSGNIDQDKIAAIKLVKGYNLLVVKTVNINDRWIFFFRFATADGSPIEFRQQTMSAQELESFCRKMEKELSL